MKKLLYYFAFICSLPFSAFSQHDVKLHSHNDYLRESPFWEAFGAGCASIEVDVFLKNGALKVAHEEASIRPDRTLKSLYLEPIRKAKSQGKIDSFDFHLLIDIKTEAYATLDQLMKDAVEFKDLFFSANNPAGLKLIISGNRPKSEDYEKYPEWVFFDYQSKILTAELPWEKIGMVSLNFNQFSTWSGTGELPAEERVELEEFVALVHSFQKPVRFWASPDGKHAWQTFHRMGINYINTDQPENAGKYLQTLR